MAEPISGIQNQTIFLKVSHESSHMVSLQQYTAQAAAMHSAQTIERKTQAQMRSATGVQSTEQKQVRTATDSKSQGEYLPNSAKKDQEKNQKELIKQDNSHILDVRV
ncbi:hypothetical protein [Fervidobacterium sp.]